MLRTWLLALSFFFLSSFCPAGANPPSYITTSDGVIVFTDPLFTGVSRAVKLEVINDHIIRVIAAPGKQIPKVESLATVYAKQPVVKWNLVSSKEKLILKTRALTAVIHLKSGVVSFLDANGKQLLAEKPTATRQFEPVVYDGRRSYQMVQTFQTGSDDNFYGLGQHQDDVFNYKGRQVNMFQNNTEVAIPFLISTRNYGILWDNYSLTKVGDIRPFRQLSTLALYSKNGDAGWLTASYSNDKKKPEDVVVERAETNIQMEFLNDSRIYLPKEFKPENGIVTWDGSVASDFSGIHQIKLTYGGSLKVWLNEKLILDRWRKAWNPAPALLDVPINKGSKVSIRIQWIPEGAESYLSLKWKEPADRSEQNDYSFSSEAGQQIDYYFIKGKSMDDVIAGYRFLTGKAPLAPKWAFGFWQSRERYKTQDEILEVAAEFRKRQIPFDNIVLDWSYWKEDDWGSQDFDKSRFPSPDSMIALLHKKYNTHFMISVWPKFYEGIPAYKAFETKGWLYKKNVADRQRDWIGKGYISTFYDAFNEGARKGFWDLIHEKIYRLGVDAWWMDASEPDILSNVSPEKRKQQMTPTALGPAAEYLNAYPLQNAKGIYEGQREADPGKRVFLLTRSGYAGSQRYGATIWSGDIGATWHDMKAQIPAGINFSMSGLPYWTMDIGGFVVPRRFEQPGENDLEEWRELLTRWHQFGAFVPVFRSHGQYPYREIFNVAPEQHPAYQSMVWYNKLRYRMLPYIYSVAGMTWHEDYTMMRGLVMDFPNDTAVVNIGDQYMFGPSLLVSPVYEYKQRQRELYLPKGQGWFDLYTGKWFEGGQNILADAPFEKMPVFVKEGSIIPLGPALQYTNERPADTISLFVYTGKNAYLKIYEDGGESYEYEKGSYSNIPIIYNQNSGTLTLGERIGSFEGMIPKRVFRVYVISRNEARILDFGSAADKQVSYDGRPVVIKL